MRAPLLLRLRLLLTLRLRALAAGKRAAEMSPEEWRARVALVVAHLHDPEPLAADLAFAELEATPYAAMRTAKPHLDAAALRQWRNCAWRSAKRNCGSDSRASAAARTSGQSASRPLTRVRICSIWLGLETSST